MRSRLVILATLSVLAVPVNASAAATFEQLWLAGFDMASLPKMDVSEDGGVVVGPGLLPGLPQFHALRWTAEDGRVEPLFETPDVQFLITGTAVSADGSVVVGAGLGPAYRWTAATGALPIGTELSFFNPHDVSADGAVVVGQGARFTSGAFLWTETTGPLQLSASAWGLDVSATATSADGTVIVGRTHAGGNHSIMAEGAFRWTVAGGTRQLGELPGAASQYFESSALGISADGSIVVGYADSDAGWQAFRWSAPEGMIGLGYLPGAPQFLPRSSAYAVSADGSVIVGSSFSAGGRKKAFIWDAVHGMRDLQEVLVAEHGLDFRGWELIEAQAVSADGRVVVGHAFSPGGAIFAYRVSIPEPLLLMHIAAAGLLSSRRRNGRSDHRDDRPCASS